MSFKLGRKFEMTIYPAQYLHTLTDGTIAFSSSGVGVGTAVAAAGILSGGVAAAAGVASVLSEVEEAIIITNPFTLELLIRRRALSSVNLATFRIYNLNENTRNQLYKDYQNLLCLRRVTLRAGYSDPLPIVFDGNIKWCTSCRQQGSTNFITEIEAYDWSFATVNAISNKTFPGQVKKQEVVDQLIKDLSRLGISRGYVHQYADTDIAYNKTIGPDYSWEILRKETQDSCFIDSGQLNILSEDECFEGVVDEISSDTGLLGAPKRSETYVMAEMLFEPTLAVGQLIKLNTESQKIFNGNYKVFGINHFGTISDAVGGKCQTNVSLFSFKKNEELVSKSESSI